MGEFKFLNPNIALQPEGENENEEVLNLREEIKDGIKEIGQLVGGGQESLYVQKLNSVNNIKDEDGKIQALNTIRETLQEDIKHYKTKNAV